MTSKLKCPFCGEDLDTENYYVHCHNPHCNTTVEMEGTEEMWEALIQSQKDLEIARKALLEITTGEMGCKCSWCGRYEIADKALEQIEHKE